MAALTFLEKMEMASKLTFQRRMKMGIKALAESMNITDLTTTSNYLMQKYKERVMTGDLGVQLQDYCEYFLLKYTQTTPSLDENNELTDNVLTNGNHATNIFKYFAGVKPEYES